MNNDKLIIGGHEFNSRFILGSGKYSMKLIEAAVKDAGLSDVPVKVALMGCVVNGPGEAREADVGIAGGKGEAMLFRHGEIVEKIPENQIIERLLQEIRILKDQKQL
jgi:(E)-4-hydroxy-3-methylbut-2-enyl-diphosphate synthase